jgi:tetratricopeptide (TPR) repeat protein
LHPDNAKAAYELGVMYRNDGRIEDAQRYFEQALLHYPDFAEAQLGLAAVLLEENQAEKARVTFNAPLFSTLKRRFAGFALPGSRKVSVTLANNRRHWPNIGVFTTWQTSKRKCPRFFHPQK